MKQINEYPLKLNLQFFAEGEEQGTDQELKDEGSKDNQTQEADKPEEVEFTPEQQKKIDEIVKREKAKEKRKADDAVKEAEKLAKMNAQQKQEYELEQAQKRIQELEQRENLYQMKSEANKMLSEKGISVNDDLLNFVAKDTAEETQEMVNTFIEVVNSEVQKQVAEKLRGGSPKTSDNGNNSGYMSMEEIQKIPDSTERARLIRKYHIK